jgi:hypothetical protein
MLLAAVLATFIGTTTVALKAIPVIAFAVLAIVCGIPNVRQAIIRRMNPVKLWLVGAGIVASIEALAATLIVGSSL